MSLESVIRHFEAIGRVPVELPDVIAEFKKLHIERIITHGIDGGGKALRGLHIRYKKVPPEGSVLIDESIVRVIYSTQLPMKWQRVVCCKELIHVFDPSPLLTTNKRDVVRLCADIARKNGHLDPANHIKTTFDLLAQWKAMTILFPFSLYEAFLDQVKSGDVSIAQISDWTQIPEFHVATIMTDEWATVREQLIR